MVDVVAAPSAVYRDIKLDPDSSRDGNPTWPNFTCASFESKRTMPAQNQSISLTALPELLPLLLLLQTRLNLTFIGADCHVFLFSSPRTNWSSTGEQILARSQERTICYVNLIYWSHLEAAAFSVLLKKTSKTASRTWSQSGSQRRDENNNNSN